MLLSLDFESDIPIYTQLKTLIIEGIATGELAPGEALPSVRMLSSDLGINMHTVNKAYNILRQDGFIIIHRQKGVVVNTGEGPTVTNAYLSRLNSDLRPIAAEAVCRGMEIEDFNKLCSKIFEELKSNGGDIK